MTSSSPGDWRASFGFGPGQQAGSLTRVVWTDIKKVTLSSRVLECDVVYRWVSPQIAKGFVSNPQRYRDYGELRYSMRSFARLAGVRNLHVVAKGSPPGWLNISHPRIFWWNETIFLEELRLALGITAALRVANSEPAKLAIARIPNLSERFILVDDDTLLIPRAPNSTVVMSTHIFFDHQDLPLHPLPITSAHRPAAMLRSAYVNAIATTAMQDIAHLLSSGDVRPEFDLLEGWVTSMWHNGASRPVKVPKFDVGGRHGIHRGPSFLKGILGKSGAGSEASSLPGQYLSYQWHHPKAVLGDLVKFMQLVELYRPLFICVNDDFDYYRSTFDSAAVSRVIQTNYERLLPQRQPWELQGTADDAADQVHAVKPIPNARGNGAATLVRDGQAASTAPQIAPSASPATFTSLVPFTCTGSGEVLHLPEDAFQVPPRLQPLLDSVTAARRSELLRNVNGTAAESLTASISHLELVDVHNGISSQLNAPRLSAPGPKVLRVAEFNAERGRHWCEIATQVLRTPELKEVDVWLLNEFDLGMARSGQHHTVRLLAYALGLNYAWGVEFVELSNGNKEEQQRTSGQTNQHGLHGNAILSRWPLHEVEVVRMPGMAPLFNGTGSETDFGHEKRLGSRMTIFANTGPPASKLIVGATHTQTSWGRHKTHTSAVVQSMLSHLRGRVSGANASKWLMGKDTSDPLVLLGGDTWPETCKWLGLSSMVRGRSPAAIVTQGKVVVTRNKPMDDYICGSAGFTTFGAPRRIAGVGHPTNGSGLPEFTLSDHVFVSTQLSWP